MVFKADFQKSEKHPLGDLFFNVKENGVQLKIPALSKRWVEPRCYTKYRGPLLEDGKFKNQAAIGEWISESEWFNSDMQFLLSLEHFRFWSYIIFEPKCMESIVSFLQEATPSYIPFHSIIDDERAIDLYKSILQTVLAVVCRIITNKESETEWIARDHLKELLYSNFLISVPMIFDLIVTYGRSNISVLSKIVQTVFVIEPKYNNDVKAGLKFIQKTFNLIQKRVENEGAGDDNEPVSTYDDLALFTLDCATSLSIFLEIYPDARSTCCEIQLDQSIAKFYDNTIPLLYKNIYTINPQAKSLDYVNLSRRELLKGFRSIVYFYIESILRDPDQSLLPSESFIAILTECLADRTFVIDYQNFYPVENDIDILKQACKDLDLFKTDFVLKAYTSEGESYLKEMVQNTDLDKSLEDNLVSSDWMENYENGAASLPPSESLARDIEREVGLVSDLFPQLGDGFIRRILSRYENVELATAALFEGNLPPDLAEADQTEVYIPPDIQDTLYLQTGVRRNNVFDGDKYDIMTQDNPEAILKKGKGFPGQPKTITQLLDDKTHVKALKDRFQEYSIITDEYDDEYDDSYEALAESESKANRSKAIKDVLVDEVDDDDDEEESEDEKAIGNGKEKEKPNNNDFCENPEIIRARYEERRNAKFAAKSKNQKNFDVVGKSKGQGQEKDVVINRHKKEANKSSRANHNRKSGSSWKRSRGMIPS